MVNKLFIYVCPTVECSAIASRPETKCPKHKQTMTRECYIREKAPKGTGKDPLEDLLGNMFKGRPR